MMVKLVPEIPKIVDITPEYSPGKLAETMTEMAPDAVAGFFVLMREDGSMYHDMCGMGERDILWALEKSKLKLMED